MNMKTTTVSLFLSVMTMGAFQPAVWAQSVTDTPMREVTKGVYQHHHEFYTQLVVITKKGVAIVDPDGAQRSAKLQEEIRKLTDKPVTLVIYSHEHYDHARGGQIFKKEGATFVSHEKCRAALENDPQGQVVPPDTTYSGETHRLTVGETSIDLYHFGMSHGTCMTVVHLPKEKVLFVTDIHEPKGLTSAQYLTADYHYPGVYRTLKRIQAELTYDVVVGSHAPHSSPKAFNEDVGMVEYLYENVLQAVKAGKNAEETKQAIPFPPLNEWRNVKEWPAHVAHMYEALNQGK